MTVKDIVKSVYACLTDKCKCSDCIMFECDRNKNCQKELAIAVEAKFNELIELLDDEVNHHYYDTLETYQETCSQLQDTLDKIEKLIKKNST